ncbi:MAG: FAD:protein FMN transferase [Planctomycetaceae bacterium]
MSDSSATRRDFLAGRALRDEIVAIGQSTGDAMLGEAEEPRREPTSGATIRLATSAMATDFAVILNEAHRDDPRQPLRWASEALDLIHLLEDQMSVYRPHTELSQLNRVAASRPVVVEERLFELLCCAREIWRETDGCFDPTSGPLIALWRQCRKEVRLPTEAELAERLALVGMQHVAFPRSGCERIGERSRAERGNEERGNEEPSNPKRERGAAERGSVERGSVEHSPSLTLRVTFDRLGVELNLGSIGKGYALDRAAEILNEHELTEWLLQGGHSSVIARGGHNGLPGWPVGLRNPLLPQRRLGTILLRDQALATSGTAVQHFRFEGKRYGHIIDPRTGWPTDTMLSVTVLAPTAAEADALSTAFFVGGVEIARRYCSNHQSVSALLIPPPVGGQRLEPINIGVSEDALFWNDE